MFFVAKNVVLILSGCWILTTKRKKLAFSPALLCFETVEIVFLIARTILCARVIRVILESVLTVLSSVFFLGAIYFSFALSKETGNAKYWVFFLLASVAFFVAHLSAKDVLGLEPETGFVVKELSEIAGAFSLAYATFGLYSSMKKVREKIGSETGE